MRVGSFLFRNIRTTPYSAVESLFMRAVLLPLLSVVLIPTFLIAEEDPASPPQPDAVVSYSRDVLPILRSRCQGCHQPAKLGGGYELTSHTGMLGEGESGIAGIVPGKPDESYLLEQITPHDGVALMPQSGDPLSAEQIAVITRWIEQGAKDDSPASTARAVDADHPPVYTRPPSITTLAYSPDGSTLAIAGYHEVLLWTADGTEQLHRLVGLSSRIESVAFSPDGESLAIAGGRPAEMGELQIWNVADGTLTVSIPVGYDTIYGASWSPDGKLVSVGCPDSVVRGFDVETGEQVFFNGAHDDWPLATVFSTDGSMLVSVGRDMSTRLYHVPTERFIDNVTSITPGALKGGLSAVARHPGRDEILVGGADGVPRIYRMERVTKRVIGDDANLIRRFPAMTGRIQSVAYAPDGKTLACVSSLDGKSQLCTFSCDVPFEMPDEIKKIVEKVVGTQSADEVKMLEEHVTSDVQKLIDVALPAGSYSLSYSPDGQSLAVAGGDGLVRVFDAATGEARTEFCPVSIEGTQDLNHIALIPTVPDEPHVSAEEPVPTGFTVSSLEVTPPAIELDGPFASVQVLVTAKDSEGRRLDVTRQATIQSREGRVTISRLGRVRPGADGSTHHGADSLQVEYGGQKIDIPVKVAGLEVPSEISFIRDVNPVLTRAGCNQGTCHGAKDGKNGFKLSLRGYDPLFDVRSLTDDIKGRRTNVASPEDSLMLLKATAAVPHTGGQLMKPGEASYEILRRWIEQGTKLDLNVERVASIEIEPQLPVTEQIGGRQQIRVIATYTNGRTRDVTADAFIESGNTEVAEVNRAGVLTALRRGEAPVLARFEGAYAATTLTVMGDRDGFAWEEPEQWSDIDRLTASKWKRMKIRPSGLSSDVDFLRRVTLDLTGLPPTPEKIHAFLADDRPTREKRDAVIDELIGSAAYVEYWSNKWADLLQVNSKFLGSEGAAGFRNWIRESVAANKPYDQFCHEILTASGSNRTNPPASYYKTLREPDAMMENTTHLFLAIRFNCNKCHDHPFERWTQDQYYETAAFFAQVDLQRDPENSDGNIGGTAVEGAKPLWEVIKDAGAGEIHHDRTGEVTMPKVPYDRSLPVPDEGTRREQLAEWITSPENDYFAKTYVNRVWGYLLGVGLIEPLDDVRAGNPASNPELLDYLTEEFVASGFDVQQLMRMICKSRTYQLELATNEWNRDDVINYSHALPKRLPAEVLYDAVYSVTGAKMKIPGVPEGTRAAALPDVAIGLDDGFLANLGRPVRESACECERSSELQLGPVMALMNGETVSTAISQPGSTIARLVDETADNAQLVNEIFLRVLNRPASEDEVQAVTRLMQSLDTEQATLEQQLAEYEKKIAPVREKMEAERLAVIQRAEETLTAYEAEIQPRVDAEEQARQKKIDEAKSALEAHLATEAERQAEWEESLTQNDTPWSPLAFQSMTSTNEADLVQEDDQAVFVTGKEGKTAYILNVEGPLADVTAIKLEALADERLSSMGPGRAPNGNFVLSEFRVAKISESAASEGDQADESPMEESSAKTKVKLQNPKADFAQEGYAPETTIDGRPGPNGMGWAVVPNTGESHQILWELAEPLTLAESGQLELRLDQNYQDGKHALGRFRISVTTKAPPVGFGIEQEIFEIAALSTEDRTEVQAEKIRTRFQLQDAELKDLRNALTEAEKPLPRDPELVRLEKHLEECRQPLPEDPTLVRLTRAVKLGQEQLQNQRLTAAQDLVWALINSPAFLFNH